MNINKRKMEKLYKKMQKEEKYYLKKYGTFRSSLLTFLYVETHTRKTKEMLHNLNIVAGWEPKKFDKVYDTIKKELEEL